ncbi:MAG: hypothetical protein IT371_09415 [Deltaproteobacteria bacterium]|nr:hypothetical protein [Deltaproteobacteria bacterium]
MDTARASAASALALFGLLGLAGLAACDGDPVSPGLADGPEPAYEAELFRSVLSHLTSTSERPQQGDWPFDQGDAAAYGPGLLLRYGAAGKNAAQLALAEESLAHDERTLKRALADIGSLLDQLSEVMMAAMGLIEAQQRQHDAARAEKLDKILAVLRVLAKTYDYWPEPEGLNSLHMQLYGPTTVCGGLALLDLELALAESGAERERRTKNGLEILESCRKKGYDAARGYYRFSSTRAGLFLYPNVMQMLGLLRAHQLTGRRDLLEQARDLHRAIQPLKVKGEGRYRSPYSAEWMGAKTDDYTTLSAQNYTLLALAIFHQVTGEPGFRQEVLDILAFLRTHLLDGGRVLHHWMDGRRALPTDREYYCSGCNLQLLYLIWRLGEFFHPAA